MEKLVIDANVVISALIRKGFTFDLIVGLNKAGINSFLQIFFGKKLRKGKVKYLNIPTWKKMNWIF